MSWNSNICINFVNVLYVMEWHPCLTQSLIVQMDHSMSPMYSFLLHVCRCDGDKKFSGRAKFIITIEVRDGENPVLVLSL